MRSVKIKTPKIQVLSPKPIGGFVTTTTGSHYGFLSTEVAGKPFQVEWDNEIRDQVGEHLVRLRRYRGMSQDDVAKAMHTSQSAVARIESGQENITLDTLKRHVTALHGHFVVSIGPDDVDIPRMMAWWKWTEVLSFSHRLATGRPQPFAAVTRAPDATTQFLIGYAQHFTARTAGLIDQTGS